MEGGGGFLKKRTKTNRGRGVKPICTFVREKKLPDFSSDKQSSF